jgi:GT2 family glycosyltransferase
MTLSIIVISYKNCDMTFAYLKSIHDKITLKDFDIILIDNNSTDSSVDAIRKQFPFLRLFSLNKNLGFTKANNYAAQFVGSEYLPNPDTVFLNGTIDKLLVFTKQWIPPYHD